MENIPSEIFAHVFQYLDGKSIAKLNMTSKKINACVKYHMAMWIPNLDTFEWSDVFRSMKANILDQVEMLKQSEKTTFKGFTLEYWVQWGHLKKVKKRISEDNIEIPDWSMEELVYLAALRKKYKVFKYLIRSPRFHYMLNMMENVKVYYDHVSKYYCFRDIISTNNAKIIRILVENTPLDASYLVIACELNNLDLVKLLIERGADVNVPAAVPFCVCDPAPRPRGRDYYMQLPLEAAYENDHTEIVDYLETYGAVMD